MTARRDAAADADVDVESLRKSARRPLDAFLLVSVLFLFLTVAAVVAFVATVLKQPHVTALQERRDSSRAAYKVSKAPPELWVASFSGSPSQTSFFCLFFLFIFLTDGELCVSGSNFK